MTNDKRDRFARLFPDRAQKLIKSLGILANCSNKSNYEFDVDLVTRVWIEVAKQFHTAAKCFDVDFQVLIDGKDIAEIDTSKEIKS